MSHVSQIAFFKSGVKSFPQLFGGKVIDIGSLDINGGPHRLLNAREYVGVDLAPGPNVDLVSRGELVDLPTGYFDVAMSSECFEHNPAWRETLHNMIRMVRPGGLVIFSCATTGRPEHGTSRSDGGSAAPLAVEAGQEYYENVTESDAIEEARKANLARYFVETEPYAHDLYFAALKTGVDEASLQEFHRFETVVRNRFSLGFVRTPSIKRWAFRLAKLRDPRT